MVVLGCFSGAWVTGAASLFWGVLGSLEELAELAALVGVDLLVSLDFLVGLEELEKAQFMAVPTSRR